MVAAAPAVVATAAVLLVLGTAVSTWQAIRATRAERKALDDRNRAEVAEANARAEAAKANAINEFLVSDLLEQADPAESGLTHQVTLREVLDRAAEKVGARFRDRPLLEAALHTTIGKVYSSLQVRDKRRDHLSAALAIYERERGPQAVETANVMTALGGALEEEDRYAEAEPLLRRGLDALQRAVGEEHPDTLQAMNNVAFAVYRGQGKLAEAEPMLDKALALSRRVLGEQHRNTLITMNNLGEVYRMQGKLVEAEPLLLSSYEGLRTREPSVPTQPGGRLINSLKRIILLYEAWGKPEKAAERWRGSCSHKRTCPPTSSPGLD